MTTPRFLELIEHFVSNYTPAQRREFITLDKAFRAGESLALPSSTVFLHDINMSGYVLRVCGDTIFREGIADAVILALGKIVIEGTSKNCTIFSLDSIQVGRSETSVFVCYGDLLIESETENCTSNTMGSIIGERASVLGGSMNAGSDIVIHSAYTLTNKQPTTLSVGSRALYLSTLRILNNYITRLNEERSETREQLKDATRMALARPSNSVVNALQQLNERQARLDEEFKKKKELLDALRHQAATLPNRNSTVSVLAYAGNNVAIDIGGRKYITAEPMSSVEFSVQDGAISVGPARYRPQPDDDQVTYIEL